MTISYQKQQSIAKSNEKWLNSDKRRLKKPARKRTYVYQGIPRASFSDLALILGEHED